MAEEEGGNVVGFHIYWTPATKTEAPKLGSAFVAADLARGPDGIPIVMPVDLALDAWPPHLLPGRYRLVPVDDQGTELENPQVIERVIDDAAQSEHLQALTADAGRRIATRVAGSPELQARLSSFQDSERLTMLALAVQDAVQTTILKHSWTEVMGPEREGLIDSLATAVLDRIAGEEASDKEPVGLNVEAFNGLLLTPWECDLDRIRASIERADYDDAAIRALVRAAIGLSLPSDVVSELLVGVTRIEAFVPLSRHATAASLIELLDVARFSNDLSGIKQALYTAFAIWQMQPEPAQRQRLVRHLRSIARYGWLSMRAHGLTAWFIQQLQEPHLTAIYESARRDPRVANIDQDKLAENAARVALYLWKATIPEAVALLPAQAQDPLPLGPVTMRASVKVGRNERCPCGSGKKYKRCCADKPSAAVAAPKWSRLEYLRALEPRLDRKQVSQLSRADLAHLDVTRLAIAPLIDVVQRRVNLHDWGRARAAIEELRNRGRKDVADELLMELLKEAAAFRQYKVVQDVLEKLDHPSLGAALALEATLARRSPDALAQLEAAALEALKQPPAVSPSDLAHAVLHTAPALGILIARGVIAIKDREADLLLDPIEDAHDELALPPGDPAEQIYEDLGGIRRHQDDVARIETERARLAADVEAMQETLDQTTTRVEMLQRQLTDQERKDQQRGQLESSQLTVQSLEAARERRAARDKIDTLQALIREGNEERALLRRQLADAAKDAGKLTTTPSGPRPTDDDDDDADVAEELPSRSSARPAVLPRFTSRAIAAFETVSNHVRTIGVRTIGELAAGDVKAWRQIKQAKDMPRQVLMGRVGIHHRVLFRTDADALDVIDLVTRESLETTLKRLRSAQ